MIPQSQYPFDPPLKQWPWATAVTPLPPTQFQPLTGSAMLADLADLAGKLLILGIAGAALYAAGEAIFGTQKRVVYCCKCNRPNHTARNCPIAGKRTRLNIEKTGVCSCCNRRVRYTEGHHYAGRAVKRGREMCAPCHLHCGHGGVWGPPINPRFCRL